MHKGTFEYFPKGEGREFGLAYYKGVNYAPYQPVLAVCHGIDEGGPGDLTGLKKVTGWGGWLNLYEMADFYKFNIVFTQSSMADSTGEIDYALLKSEEDIKAHPKRKRALGYSWGGRRWRLWLSRNAENAKKITSAIIVAPGGVNVDAATNIVAANLPVWIFHHIKDARTSYQNGLATFDAAKKLKADAPVYYSQFNTVAKDPHNILGIMSGSWLPVYAVKTDPAPSGYPFPYTQVCKKNIVEWQNMIEWYGESNPNGEMKSEVEIPHPEIPQHQEPPMPKLLKTIEYYSNGTFIERIA